MHIFPMKYQHFRFDIVRLHLRQSHRWRTTKLNAEAFKSARGRKVSLRVTFFAPSLDSIFRLISGCSKYVTFSITFGALVLQTSLRSVWRLATSGDEAGPEVRPVRVPPSFPALMSPESARIHASTPHREQFLRAWKWFPTSRISSVGGDAMYM